MRLNLFFLMLILLPLAAVAHAYFIAFHRLPLLRDEVVQILDKAGVTEATVNLTFLDIDIAGKAPSPKVHQQIIEAIRRIGPLRVKQDADRLFVEASIKADLHGERLRVSGWLPEENHVTMLKGILTEVRPDLTLDLSDLLHAAEVRWPADFKSPLDTENPFLGPILDMLHVPAELKVDYAGDTIRLSGMLPSGALKDEIVSAIAGDSGASLVDPAGLKASPHVNAAPFAKSQALAAFLASFFAAPPPRSFEIHDTGSPILTGAATRRLESEWLTLLRPVTGGATVDSHITLLPSVYHMPGYKTTSPLPAATLDQLRDVLRCITISFEPGSSRIPPLDQTRLAALAPALLGAGPTLSLVIGGHPDSAGDLKVESALAQARAETVLSFLIEQGVPNSDITAMAFEPVPPGSPAAPQQPRSVEILVK